MSAVGLYLKLRCFLEGVEVPIISAVIQSQKNAAAVSSLQILANDFAMDLKPRTLVHVYCYDPYRGAPPRDQVFVGGDSISVKQEIIKDPDASGSLIPPPVKAGPSAEQSEQDLINENYKLIFGGELVGIQYSKEPSSRGVVLQCVDWSSYWDIAYQYQIGGFSLGGGGIKAAFTGASTTVFNDFLEGSGDIVLKLMETPPRSYPALKGTLLGAIVHILEAIGGCYYGKRSVRGTNDFFSLAEMRLHITQMIGANPYSSEDERRLMRANGFGSLFTKALGGLGKQVTIRQVLMALQRYIFHEIVPITAPRFIPALTDPNSPQSELVPLSSDPSTAPIVRAARTIKERVLDLKSRQEGSTSSESAKKNSEAKGGLQKEISAIANLAAKAQVATKRAGAVTGAWAPLADFFGLASVSQAFETTTRQLASVLFTCKVGLTGAFAFPLASTQAAKSVISALDSLSVLMDKVLEAKTQKRVQRTTSQPDPPPRLLTQIYRPDVWMVAPPRCNVLFPELYSSFSYGRNFNAEVTRMLLRTHSAFFGSDILFDGFYMAPSRLLGARSGKKIGKGRVGIDPPDLTDAPAWVVKDMMDHELYTGILPAFERMSDLNLHALRGGSVEINGAKVGYAQLACNHIFFQHRFKSRDLMVSGKFNPYFVLGFPALVVDRYMSEDQLRDPGTDVAVAAKFANDLKVAQATGAPPQEKAYATEVSAAEIETLTANLLADRPSTHYLGTPAMVSHQISASSGGTTQIQMEYARTSSEKTEFLGDNVGRSSQAKRIKNIKVSNNVAALQAPIVGGKGILGGKITEVKNVTDQFQKKQVKKKGSGRVNAAILGAQAPTSRYASSTLLPVYVPEGGFSGRVRRGTKVPVGVSQPAAAYGPEIVAIVGSGGADIATDANIEVTFDAYKITEEVGAYRTQDVELPPEELTFPPWYGDTYRTQKIGGLYSYFFGTGAITDPTVVLGGSSPRKFGEGDGRTLYIDLLQKFSRLEAAASAGAVSQPDQLPPAGLASTPDAIGPAGEKDPMEDVLGEVKVRSPIALAIEEIVRAYSAVRLQRFDVAQFVQNYTWRPIASMLDVFGTANLNIDDNGFVTSGREGFHSRAFGPYDDLRQLATGAGGAMPQKILGLTAKPLETSMDNEKRDAAISARLDTRREKQMAVLRYLHAVAASRGVLLG